MQRYDRILPPPSNSVGGNAAEQDLTSNNNEILCSLTAHRTYAFTLVELSIVLVIIGLVAGGILVGRDLIYAANVRAQITQIEQLETAINTFKTKYNCIPGDCANAADYFTSFQGFTVYNGNGDGQVKSAEVAGTDDCFSNITVPWATVSTEPTQLFLHLNASGIGNYNISKPVGASGSNPFLPLHKFGGMMFVSCLYNGSTIGIGVQYPNFNNHSTGIILAALFGYGQTRTVYNAGWSSGRNYLVIPPDVAQAIDTKIDDGVPSTGKFGVLFDCNSEWSTPGNILPSSYSGFPSNCNVSLVKKLWD